MAIPTFSRLPVFLGHLPPENTHLDVYRALERVLAAHVYVELEFPNPTVSNNFVMKEVRSHIDRAFLCVFDLSHQKNATVLLELGYALGRDRFSIVLFKKQSRPLPGITCHGGIAYGSAEDLVQKLEGAFPELVGGAIREYTRLRSHPGGDEPFGEIDAELVSSIGAALLEGAVADEYQLAGERGFSDEQMERTLAVFKSFKIAEERSGAWRLTELGQGILPGILAGTRDEHVFTT